MRIFIAFFLLFISFLPLEGRSFTVPAFTPNVVDDSQTLPNDSVESLNKVIDAISKAGNAKPAVYITNSLQGDSVEDVAEQVFNKWGLGTKGKDDGVLILVALKDRRMRIEVGYGLEGELTDLRTSEIINGIMKPAFRREQYEKGITEALQQIAKILNGEYVAVPFTERSDPNEEFNVAMIKERAIWWIILFLGLPALIQSAGLLAAGIKKPEAFRLLVTNKKINRFLAVFGFKNRNALFLKLFLFINPGLFVVLFPVVFRAEGDEVSYIFNSLGAIAVLLSVFFASLFVYQLFSLKAYKRNLARERLQKFRRKKPAGSTYSMFGRTYTTPSRSSSSSSSSSGSSSSGGGRSGGGGSSGSW